MNVNPSSKLQTWENMSACRNYCKESKLKPPSLYRNNAPTNGCPHESGESMCTTDQKKMTHWGLFCYFFHLIGTFSPCGGLSVDFFSLWGLTLGLWGPFLGLPTNENFCMRPYRIFILYRICSLLKQFIKTFNSNFILI